MSGVTSIHISRLHYPVTRLGPGRRIGIWMQGCSIRCSGCISADTWRQDLGQTTIGAVIGQVQHWIPDAEGFTISGGEPFDQPEALIALLRGLREQSSADILVFTGHPFESLTDVLTVADGLIDALVTDPFDYSAPQTLALRGSDNQRLHCLTELGAARFSSFDRLRRQSDHGLDLMMDDDGTFWLAGIPSRDDFEQLKKLLKDEGHRFFTSDVRVREGEAQS